jgi:methyl-accepting chemotaxis protein
MKLGTKITLAAVAAVVAGSVVGLVVQRHMIQQVGVERTFNTMRGAVLQAESVRAQMASLNEAHAFDREVLLAELAKGGKQEETAFFRSVPIIAAMRSVADIAEEQGFEFRVPKEQPRNPKNEPSELERELLKELEAGARRFNGSIAPRGASFMRGRLS